MKASSLIDEWLPLSRIAQHVTPDIPEIQTGAPHLGHDNRQVGDRAADVLHMLGWVLGVPRIPPLSP